jgi:hypothetical protein
MGYRITILRTVGVDRNPITSSEVELVMASIPGWKFDKDNGQATFFIAGQELVTAWLNDGTVWTKNPTDEAITAMLRLAEGLSARVRGDEFETYRTAQEVYVHADDKAEKSVAEANTQRIIRKTKRNQWVLNLSIIAFFVVMSLIVNNCSGS